jgi:hypothetical protein
MKKLFTRLHRRDAPGRMVAPRTQEQHSATRNKPIGLGNVHMKIQQLIVLGALLSGGDAALAGVTIKITDFAAPGTPETYASPSNILVVTTGTSPILDKYFGTSVNTGNSNAGVSMDFASAIATTSNLTATQALVNATNTYGAGLEIEFLFEDFIGPTGLVEWSSRVNASRFENAFYSAQSLVNGNLILQTLGNVSGSQTTEGSLTFDTALPIEILKRLQIGATAVGGALALDFTTDGVQIPIPLPGSLALLGIGLAGLGVAGVRQRRTADRSPLRTDADDARRSSRAEALPRLASSRLRRPASCIGAASPDPLVPAGASAPVGGNPPQLRYRYRDDDGQPMPLPPSLQ